MMGAGSWEVAIVLSKALSYFGILRVIGGLFVILLAVSRQPASVSRSSNTTSWSPTSWSSVTRQRLFDSMLAGALLGAIAIVLFFLLEVGSLSQTGITGMFDRLMGSIVASSTIGQGAGLKLAGFVVMGVALLLWRRKWLTQGSLPLWMLLCWGLALLLFTLSFAVLGHVVNLPAVARIAVMLHVGMVGLWIGSLYPLYILLRHEPASATEPLLTLFGNVAWFVLAVLGVAGLYLVWGFFNASHGGFFSSAYGRLLVLKLLLVSCLLFLAALNKFRLTPGLTVKGGQALSQSIRGEMLLAAMILMVTATFTTVVGPGH